MTLRPLLEAAAVAEHSPTQKASGGTLVKGSLWVTFAEIATQVGALATQVLAARVLDPKEFGLMGAIYLMINILNALTNSGFEQALIQRSDVRGLYNVAWTWHVLRGVSLGLLMAVASPFLAQWYGERLLIPLALLTAVAILAQGGQNIGVVGFSRELEFRKLFTIQVLRAAVHLLVSIPAILIFRNVWSLALGYVASAVAALVISYIAHPYRPRFEWNWQKVRVLLSYGRWITGLTLFGFLVTQGDDLFVSKYLGLTALAFYQLAYGIANMPAVQITHVISKASFPTYARLYETGPERVQEVFLNVVKATLLLSSAATIGIWMLIPDIVQHILGAKWAPIIGLTRLLVLSGFVRSVVALGGAVFQATGRPDLDLKMNLPRLLLLLFLIWPACAWRGLEGASYLVIAALSSCLPIWFVGLRSQIGLEVSGLARAIALPAVSALVLTGAFLVSAQLPSSNLVWTIVRLIVALLLWFGVMAALDRLTPFKLVQEVKRVRRIVRGEAQ